MDLKNILAIYPLSPVQEALLREATRGRETFKGHAVLRRVVRGAPDVPAFEEAWRLALERHQILRAFFVWEKLDKPLQLVRREVSFSLNRYDWRNSPVGVRAEQLESFVESERAAGFNLSSAPLVRVSLCRTGEEVHQLVCAYHRLLLDRRGMSLVLRDVLDAYDALRRGPGLAPRAAERRTYWDYLSWLKQQDVIDAEEFWRTELEGVASPTRLPVGRAAAPGESRRPETRRLAIPAASTSSLKSFARQHRLDLDTLLRGAWALLLQRYTGEEEAVFGVGLAGRPSSLQGSADIAGPFANTLPLRVGVTRDETALDWLTQLQARFEQLRRYEHTSPSQVETWTGGTQDQPRYESVVLRQSSCDEETAAGRFGDCAFDAPQGSDAADSPLTIELAGGDKADESELRITHDASAFDAHAVGRMLGHLRVILEAFAATPTRRLAELPMLCESEREQLRSFNATASEFPSGACVHHLFEEQARRTPDAVAVEFGERRLTYAQLDARSNQLARHLRSLGVRAEVLVGICLERSADMVVCLLGVMKAGGAYLPLDPAYPAERLRLMVEDSGVKVLLTERALAGRVGVEGVKAVCVDEVRGRVGEESDAAIECEAGAENLAYVIYTSGSTGRPKGVQITHRAAVNFLCSMRRVPGLQRDDTLAAVTTLCFDIAALELFLPLVVGARLVVMGRDEASDGELLAERLRRCGANVLQATPATWRQLLRAGWQPPARFRMLCGGEALDAELAVQLPANGERLWNLYGPTETTIWSSVSEVSAREAREADGALSIGRPIANTTMYVLDRHLEPTPLGVAGELYIGGAGVARGYLGRPALTAEKFVADPFSLEPGARMYRTGDVASYGAEGELRYLGRADHQVKVRGYRIELGEIEARLAEHPSVAHPVVVVREDATGDKRLAAYVVPREGSAPASGELRAYLRERLPEHMVPSFFVTMETLPLTPNGKIDRRALPAPAQTRDALEDAFVAPRDETEETLAGIWAEVLGLDRVGVHDNFFELGGHSLLGTQVVLRVQRAFAVVMPLRALFEQPSVAELAEAVRALAAESAVEQFGAGMQTITRRSRSIEDELAELDQLTEDETRTLLV